MSNILLPLLEQFKVLVSVPLIFGIMRMAFFTICSVFQMGGICILKYALLWALFPFFPWIILKKKRSVVFLIFINIFSCLLNIFISLLANALRNIRLKEKKDTFFP